MAEILLGLLLIPALFYTYNGVLGKSPDWINIAIFYVTAALVFLFEWLMFTQDRLQCEYPWLAFAIICLIGVLFVVFTFAPPQIPLFQDPAALKYHTSPHAAGVSTQHRLPCADFHSILAAGKGVG